MAEDSNSKTRILVVDDDVKLCRLIKGKRHGRTRERLREEIRDRHYDGFDRSIDASEPTSVTKSDFEEE
ncbi:MAG: hypothetical protein ACKVHO_24805 [Verrucomicrobiia bacterium]|jgi:hypothetical protein